MGETITTTTEVATPMRPTAHPPARPVPRRFGSKPSEKGYILAMSAILLIPMLAFTGFATDVGAWYARASRIQRAADAASLAGVVWQPNFATARDTARATATRNGFTNGVDGITVNVYSTGPRQLRVEIIDANVEVYFTSIFFDEIDITRDATAEYLQSLPMGSPDDQLGNDPIDNAGSLPNLWLNVGAYNAQKQSGDRYANDHCNNAVAGLTTGCSAVGNGNSSDYDTDGHFFAIDVTQVTPGQPLRIQVYDPAWTNVGDLCASNLMTGAQLNALAALAETTMNDATTRYGPASGGTPTNTPFCAGDTALSGNGGSANQAATSFIVRGPDNTPFESRDNPVLTGTCAPLTFSGRSVNATGISDRLRETTAYDAANEQGFERVPFRQHYRQWFTSCTIPAGSVTVGRYYVQVRSNPNTSALPGNQASVATATPTTTSGGHNRFALRAGFGSSGVPNGANVGVYGEGRLPIYVNVNATAGIRQANFYLARMTEEYAGEVVALTFFDIGDVSAGDVDFSVTPPPDSNIGASFTGCSIIRDGVPTLSPTVTNCGVQNMTSGTYNGRAVSVQIPIPTTYTCNEADRFGCWIRVRLDFDGAAQPTDTTTWSAAILGDPVRLVE